MKTGMKKMQKVSKVTNAPKKASPKMKMGSIKKMQTGGSSYSGPLNKKDSEAIDKWDSNGEVKRIARQALLNPKNTRDQALDIGIDARDSDYYDNRNSRRVPSLLQPRKKEGSVKMKTGGMVNSNAKVTASKVAGSKGVKSGVNPKASAQKVAKGKVGGITKAPKTASPK